MAENLIDRGWEVFEGVQRKMGQTSDEASFVGGFMTCFGVLTGRLDVGLPEGWTVMQAFALVQKNLDEYRQRVIDGQDNERRNGG